MLLRLRTTARLMQITAHPDDEDGGMLVLEARAKGASVLLLTLNRGEGGQNKVGSNLFDELGVLRSLELLASDEYYGVQQRFTRVADFGFSKSPEETFTKWHGHDTALADIVRVIRTFRPDVIASRFQGGPMDGHGHHQAAGILAREAFRAAADPNRFPEQISEGLQPWQPGRLYADNVRSTGDYTLQLDTGADSPLLGTSYVQFAMQGLRHQLSQGAGSWNVSPGRHTSDYKLVDSVPTVTVTGMERDFFDGIDTSLSGLAERVEAAGAKTPFLRPALVRMEEQVEVASRAAERNPASAAEPLLSGLELTRALIKQVGESSLPAAAKAELLTELWTKQEQFEKAAVLALGIDLHASLDGAAAAGMLVPGQTAIVEVELRGPKVSVRQIELDAPEGWKVSAGPLQLQGLKAGVVASRRFTVTLPQEAELTRPYWQRKDPETQTVYNIDDPRYATLPFPPPPLKARAIYDVGGKPGTTRAVVRGSASDGRPVAVVPPFSVLVDPATQVRATKATADMNVNVDIRNYVVGSGKIVLEAPSGWKVQPASQLVSFDRLREAKQVKFKVEPLSGQVEGRYELKAVLEYSGRKYQEGFSVVTREDLGTFYYYQPAIQRVSVVEANVPAGLKVGYLMGAGDDLPTVLKELDIDVSVISADELAHGDLARYGTIVLGIRAYDTRPDVKENNQRLLDYVSNGGTLLVQYNTGIADFNGGHYTPYPARLSRDRVSVEEAPVTILAPQDPIFHYPNIITTRDFQAWVQERGLYFIDEWDKGFQPLLSCADPGEPQHEGGLLRARYGKGAYIYTGYAFFRQLPTGVPGAIRLFINLLGAGHERR